MFTLSTLKNSLKKEISWVKGLNADASILNQLNTFLSDCVTSYKMYKKHYNDIIRSSSFPKLELERGILNNNKIRSEYINLYTFLANLKNTEDIIFDIYQGRRSLGPMVVGGYQRMSDLADKMSGAENNGFKVDFRSSYKKIPAIYGVDSVNTKSIKVGFTEDLTRKNLWQIYNREDVLAGDSRYNHPKYGDLKFIYTFFESIDKGIGEIGLDDHPKLVKILGEGGITVYEAPLMGKLEALGGKYHLYIGHVDLIGTFQLALSEETGTLYIIDFKPNLGFSLTKLGVHIVNAIPQILGYSLLVQAHVKGIFKKFTQGDDLTIKSVLFNYDDAAVFDPNLMFLEFGRFMNGNYEPTNAAKREDHEINRKLNWDEKGYEFYQDFMLPQSEIKLFLEDFAQLLMFL